MFCFDLSLYCVYQSFMADSVFSPTRVQLWRFQQQHRYDICIESGPVSVVFTAMSCQPREVEHMRKTSFSLRLLKPTPILCIFCVRSLLTSPPPFYLHVLVQCHAREQGLVWPPEVGNR